MKPIRVLQIVGSMDMGGIENFVMNVYRATDRSLVQFDFLYVVDRKCVFDDEILAMGGRIFRVCARSVSLFRHLSELKILLKAHPEWEAVHIHFSSATCLTDARIAKKAGIKKIFIHSHNTFDYHKRIHAVLKPFSPLYATRFFACSGLAGKWMFTKKMVQSRQVEIIKNGIEVNRFLPDQDVRNTVRRKIGLENAFVVGHIGRMSPAKNHDFLLEVFVRVLQHTPAAWLLLVGGGEWMEKLQNKAVALGIAHRTIFAGISSRPQDMLQAMDVFVFPSLYEGLPVTVVEAQAAGLPCIISDKVTEEVILTPGAKRLSLEKGYDDWAGEIVSLVNKQTKFDNREAIIRAGYDIAHTTGILTQYYLEKV
ncbi:MAG TPA: glycosyltransferase family 1 protein [Clostridiales bacterium]|mgnify:FL=1|jgi:glycosyltransferase involved in cell wall biosynthesis|nr:glycosyltransferase family 1 protein [Clostridiales bacterium]